MKIKVALIIAVIGFTTVILITSALGMRNVNDLSNLLSYLTGPAWDTADGAMEGTIGIEAQMVGLQRLRHNDGDPAESRAILNKGIAMANEALARMTESGLMAQDQMTRFTKAMSNYVTQRDLLIEEPENQQIFQRYLEVSARLLELIEEIEEEADSKVENENSRVATLQSRAKRTQIAGIILCLALSALLIWYIHKAVLKPVERLKQNLLDLSQGNGDLTVRLPAKGHSEFDEVARAFNAFVEKLQKTISEVQQSSTQLKTSSRSIDASIHKANSAIDQQHLSTTRVAAAIEEMTNILQQMTNHTANATSAANKAMDTAHEGADIVKETQAAIDIVTKEIDQASTVIEQLDKDSQGIASMLEIIRSIAEQTNLLALNAAIEAARAGESGRGFAVVADEVRSLASRTRDSTQDIEGIVNKLRSGSANAVSAMQQAQQKSRSVCERSDVATDSLNSIAESVTRMCDINAELANASSEQRQAVNEISESIHFIAHQSEDTHRAGKMVSDQSHELQEQVDRIEEKLGQFRVQ